MIMDKSTRETIETAGSCGEADWELFTTEQPEYQAKAKAICNGCPVKNMCLDEYFHEDGIVVGGTTPKERRKMVVSAGIHGLPLDRLFTSYTLGGIRALMLEANLREPDAIKVSAVLAKRGL